MTDHLGKQLFAPEQEQSVLGALLQDNDALDRIDGLREEHFYRYEHRLIFAEIARQIMRGSKCDVITAYEGLSAVDKAEEIGGLPYLNALAQNTPSSANIRRYADAVIDRAMKRSLYAIAAEAQDEASSSPDSALNLADRFAAKLESLATATAKDEPVLAFDSLAAHIESIDARYHGAASEAVPTGLADLDKKLNGGLRRGNLIIVAGRPKMGKAQPLTSRVLMADGTWKLMRDIAIGDHVASHDGGENVVTGVFPQGFKDTYRVTFNDGRSTLCCDEHLWKVRSRHWEQEKIVSLREIMGLLESARHVERLSIPLMSGDFGVDDDLLVDPYTLGALLGDGGLTKAISFSTAEPETLDYILAANPLVIAKHEGGVNYRLVTPRGQPNPLLEGIAALGLRGLGSHEKFIPIQYFSASRSARLALLQGLMDTDGWTEKSGTCMFSSASQKLADDVSNLARSLGCIVRRAEKSTSFIYLGERKVGLMAYVLRIACANRTELFRMPRKKGLCGTKVPRLVISKVEREVIEECQCIQVSHPSHLYVTDDYILTHNTSLALNIAANVAMDGVAGVLSMEMGLSELHDRNISSIGKIALDHMIDPKQMTDDDWPRLIYAIQKLTTMGLYLDQQPGLTLMQVRTKARQIKRKAKRLDLLVIDYLQLMSGDGDNRNAQIESITRGLKNLAKELDVPIVLLSQLNRKLEDRPNKRPQPADLRDSGSIEQDCDVAIFLYRDEVYNPDSQEKGICEVNVALNRQGAPGAVALTYIGEQTRFENLAHAWHPPPPKRAPIRSRGFADD